MTNWSITRYIAVSDHMTISMLSMSVEGLEMSCAEAADVLAPWTGDLKPNDLLSLHLMCILEKLDLSCIQFCLSFISFGT